jgi:hypothetical protein
MPEIFQDSGAWAFLLYLLAAASGIGGAVWMAYYGRQAWKLYQSASLYAASPTAGTDEGYDDWVKWGFREARRSLWQAIAGGLLLVGLAVAAGVAAGRLN